jgi:ribosomal protein S18 acetylase RimI-like enzyme
MQPQIGLDQVFAHKDFQSADIDSQLGYIDRWYDKRMEGEDEQTRKGLDFNKGLVRGSHEMKWMAENDTEPRKAYANEMIGAYKGLYEASKNPELDKVGRATAIIKFKDQAQQAEGNLNRYFNQQSAVANNSDQIIRERSEKAADPLGTMSMEKRHREAEEIGTILEWDDKLTPEKRKEYEDRLALLSGGKPTGQMSSGEIESSLSGSNQSATELKLINAGISQDRIDAGLHDNLKMAGKNATPVNPMFDQLSTGEIVFTPQGLVFPDDARKAIESSEAPAGAKRRALARLEEESLSHNQSVYAAMEGSKTIRDRLRERTEKNGNFRTTLQEVWNEGKSSPYFESAMGGINKGIYEVANIFPSVASAITGGVVGDDTRAWIDRNSKGWNAASDFVTDAGVSGGASRTGMQVASGIGAAVPQVLFQLGAAKGAQSIAAAGSRNMTAATASNVGFGTAIGMSGAQSFAGSYNEALGKGLGRGEAAHAAMLSGTITALTTAGFGKTGVESIFQNAGARQGIKEYFGSVLVEAGSEGLEEFTDEFMNGLVASANYGENRSIDQIANDALVAASVGMIMGGTTRSLSGRGSDVQKPVEPPQANLTPVPEFAYDFDSPDVEVDGKMVPNKDRIVEQNGSFSVADEDFDQTFESREEAEKFARGRHWQRFQENVASQFGDIKAPEIRTAVDAIGRVADGLARQGINPDKEFFANILSEEDVRKTVERNRAKDEARMASRQADEKRMTEEAIAAQEAQAESEKPDTNPREELANRPEDLYREIIDNTTRTERFRSFRDDVTGQIDQIRDRVGQLRAKPQLTEDEQSELEANEGLLSNAILEENEATRASGDPAVTREDAGRSQSRPLASTMDEAFNRAQVEGLKKKQAKLQKQYDAIEDKESDKALKLEEQIGDIESQIQAPDEGRNQSIPMQPSASPTVEIERTVEGRIQDIAKGIQDLLNRADINLAADARADLSSQVGGARMRTSQQTPKFGTHDNLVKFFDRKGGFKEVSEAVRESGGLDPEQSAVLDRLGEEMMLAVNDWVATKPGSPMRQNANPDTELNQQEQSGKRGSISKLPRGIAGANKVLIKGFQSGDPTTLLHETFHALQLIRGADGKSILENALGGDYGALVKWSTRNGAVSPSSVESLERMAVGFEQYLLTGRAPAPQLKPIFRKLANIFKSVYAGMRNILLSTPVEFGGGVDLDDAAIRAYDRLFTGVGPSGVTPTKENAPEGRQPEPGPLASIQDDPRFKIENGGITIPTASGEPQKGFSNARQARNFRRKASERLGIQEGAMAITKKGEKYFVFSHPVTNPKLFRNSVTGNTGEAAELNQGQAPKKQASFNFTVATSRIPQVARLLSEGRLDEVQRLNAIAVRHALADIPGLEVTISPQTGVFQGPGDNAPVREPGVAVSFKAKSDKSIEKGIQRMVDLGKLFMQDEVHEIADLNAPDTPFGTTLDNGMVVQPMTTYDFSSLTPKQIESIREKSAPAGMSITEDKKATIYNTQPTIEDYVQTTTRIAKAIADAGATVPPARTSAIGLKIHAQDGQVAGRTGVYPYSEVSPSALPNDGRLIAEIVKRIPFLTRRVFNAPNARSFFTAADLTPRQIELQKRIGDLYELLPDNDLENPNVKRAYDALVEKIDVQYRALIEGPNGMKFYFENYNRTGPNGEQISGDLYPNSKAAVEDIRSRNMLRVLKTDPAAFGPEGVDFSFHPLLAPYPIPDANGQAINYNDVFRAVHDAIAHGMFADTFGPVGEEAAWSIHLRTIDDPWARWALTTETRGQNSWVNYGPQMQGPNGEILQEGDVGFLSVTERSFARQKAALLPLEFSMTGDPELDAPLVALASEIGAGARGSLPSERSSLEDYAPTLYQQKKLWGDGRYSIESDPEPKAYAMGYATYRFALKDEGRTVGKLDLYANPQNPGWLEVAFSEIDPTHRGQGLGTEMYRQALANLPAGIRGITSDLELRTNKDQIPRIYKRFGGYERSGFAFLPRQVTEPTQVPEPARLQEGLAFAEGTTVRFDGMAEGVLDHRQVRVEFSDRGRSQAIAAMIDEADSIGAVVHEIGEPVSGGDIGLQPDGSYNAPFYTGKIKDLLPWSEVRDKADSAGIQDLAYNEDTGEITLYQLSEPNSEQIENLISSINEDRPILAGVRAEVRNIKVHAPEASNDSSARASLGEGSGSLSRAQVRALSEAGDWTRAMTPAHAMDPLAQEAYAALNRELPGVPIQPIPDIAKNEAFVRSLSAAASSPLARWAIASRLRGQRVTGRPVPGLLPLRLAATGDPAVDSSLEGLATQLRSSSRADYVLMGSAASATDNLAKAIEPKDNESQDEISLAQSERFSRELDKVRTLNQVSIPKLLSHDKEKRVSRMPTGAANFFWTPIAKMMGGTKFSPWRQVQRALMDNPLAPVIGTWWRYRDIAKRASHKVSRELFNKYGDIWQIDPETGNIANFSGPVSPALSWNYIDVFEAEMENPGSYPLSPKQRDWIADSRQIIQDCVKQMLANGIPMSIFQDSDGNIDYSKIASNYYFPRRVVGSIDMASSRVQSDRSGRTGSGQGPKAKRGFDRSRKYESALEGANDGIVYDPDPLSALEGFVRDTYSKIGDFRTINDPDLAGTTNIASVKRGTRIVKVGDVQAVFDEPTADELEKWTTKKLEEWDAIRIFKDGLGLVRALKLGIDFSAPIVQGAIITISHPVSSAKAQIAAWKTFLTPNGSRDFFLKREPMIREYVEAGGALGAALDYMEVAMDIGAQLRAKSSRAGKLYDWTVGRFNRFHSTFMDAAAIEYWTALRRHAVDPQTGALDPQAAREVALQVDRLVGRESLSNYGFSKNGLNAAALFATAPSMYVAYGNVIGSLFSKNPTEAKIAWQELGKFTLGGTLAFIGAALAAGMEWPEIEERLKPWDSKFLTVQAKMPGSDDLYEFGVGGFFRSVTRMLGQLTHLAFDNRNNTSEDVLGPLQAFAGARVAPGVSALLSVYRGVDHFGSPKDRARLVVEGIAPIAFTDLTVVASEKIANLFGVHGQFMTKQEKAFMDSTPQSALIQVVGLNAYPVDKRKQWYQESEDQASKLFSKPYKDLSPMERVVVVEVNTALKGSPPALDSFDLDDFLRRKSLRTAEYLAGPTKAVLADVDLLEKGIPGPQAYKTPSNVAVPMTKEEQVAMEKEFAKNLNAVMPSLAPLKGMIPEEDYKKVIRDAVKQAEDMAMIRSGWPQ